ncbi:GMP reductase [Gracilibacillus boraciitolerans JCM 21714]|uniref:GMP reductase n=1 Tax=Gracilibacillus boraciitolerans JCM 21714 TaxID=1298598 RepID=W4VPB1_9BACI|nr:GMP reductase [Gracilibacillus boraciitolerans JCM 21714]
MENVFDYEDIQLIPAKCIVESRAECDTFIQFGKHRFRLPVVPANMQTIIDENIALFLAKNNYFISCIDLNQRQEKTLYI